MIRFLIFAMLLLPLQKSRAAPPITGFWLTQNHDGVIAVEYCGSYLCVRIAGVFLDHPTDPTPVDFRGVTQCNLPLVVDARQIQPNLWKGHITDPRNGHVWGVELHVDPRGNLALRGFLGVPLLGQTQTWTRYPGTPPTDCRILVPVRPAGALPNRPGRAQ